MDSQLFVFYSEHALYTHDRSWSFTLCLAVLLIEFDMLDRVGGININIVAQPSLDTFR